MKKLFPMIIVLLVAFGLVLMSCSDNDSPAEAGDPSLAKLTCAQCHTDQSRLVALATPEPPPDGEAGEG